MLFYGGRAPDSDTVESLRRVWRDLTFRMERKARARLAVRRAFVPVRKRAWG